MRLLEALDQQLNLAAEGTARRLSRRQLLYRGAKGATATAAAMTIGGIFPRQAFALDNCCSYFNNNACSGCPAAAGCPPNYSICVQGNCTGCPYPGGSWHSVNCSPCGVGLASYKVCTDCWDGSNCSGGCTCLSDCYCSGCNRPEQAKAAMLQTLEDLAKNA